VIYKKGFASAYLRSNHLFRIPQVQLFVVRVKSVFGVVGEDEGQEAQ
jgi:hypothetical protein